MSVRKFKPTTPGQRHKVALDMSVITASKPEKSLVKEERNRVDVTTTGE